MRKPLRVGVIGCGRVTALRHLPALSRLDDAEVVALADTDAACLKQVADRFHITNRYPDVLALLKDAMVDVIAVCVPVRACALVSEGRHVDVGISRNISLIEPSPAAYLGLCWSRYGFSSGLFGRELFPLCQQYSATPRRHRG